MFRMQLLDLVLGKVTRPEILRGFPLPLLQRQGTGKQLDQGGLAGAIGTEQADPVAGRQGQVYPGKNDRVTISDCDPCQPQQGIRRLFRRSQGKMER